MQYQRRTTTRQYADPYEPVDVLFPFGTELSGAQVVTMNRLSSHAAWSRYISGMSAKIKRVIRLGKATVFRGRGSPPSGSKDGRFRNPPETDPAGGFFAEAGPWVIQSGPR